MAIKLRKIFASVAAALTIGSTIMTTNTPTKAMFPQPGVPAYSVPVGYPQPGVPTYVVHVNQFGAPVNVSSSPMGPAFKLPYPPLNGVVRVPSFYQAVQLVDFSTNRTVAIIPITVRNGCAGYQFGSHFYVVQRY